MTTPTVSLFDNEREANLTSSVEMIEGALIELGHIVAESRRGEDGIERSWRVGKGSAHVDVRLLESSPLWILRISAAVMTCDDSVDRAALFANLLEKNAREVTGAAFALDGDMVILVSERSTLDLDPGEVRESIERVQTWADQLDGVLVERFGGTLGASPEPPEEPT